MLSDSRKSILVIDDHDIFRRGLLTLLADCCADCDVHEAASVEEALGGGFPAPDLVLLDVYLRGVNGLDGIAPIRSYWPRAVVVMLSSLEGGDASREALARGASAFISKGEPTEHILLQLGKLLDGPAAAGLSSPVPISHLTPRQREVLLLVCQGLPNKLIARELSLSENTVRRHVQDILECLQVESRSEAVFAARRRGLME